MIPPPASARERARATPWSVLYVRVPAKPAGRWIPECPDRGIRSGHRSGSASGAQRTRRRCPEGNKTASGESAHRERAGECLRACAAPDCPDRGALPAAGRRGTARLDRDVAAAGGCWDRGCVDAWKRCPCFRGSGRAGVLPLRFQAGRGRTHAGPQPQGLGQLQPRYLGERRREPHGL